MYDRRRARWPAHLFAFLLVALTTSLGVWQLQRAAGKAAAQAGQDQALVAAARRLDGPALKALAADPGAVAALDGHRVEVRGRFDDGGTIFLDNRTRQGVPGFHVLAPLRVEGSDQVVMVLRGWIPLDFRDRLRLPALVTPADTVLVEGLAQRELAQPVVLGGSRGEGGEGEPGRLWQHYEPGRYAGWSGLQPAAVLVRQSAEASYQDGLARDWNQPGSGVDRHKAYALQWFTMAALAAVVWIGLTVGRARRRGPDEARGPEPSGKESSDRT